MFFLVIIIILYTVSCSIATTMQYHSHGENSPCPPPTKDRIVYSYNQYK
jgi:hypothetical protein